MAIIGIVEEKCTGCGICVRSCPMDVIRLDKQAKLARIVYQTDCMTCYLCQKDCREEAVIMSAARAKHIPLAW